MVFEEWSALVELLLSDLCDISIISTDLLSKSTVLKLQVKKVT